MAEEGSIDIGRVVERGFATIRRNAPGFLLLALLLAGVPSFLTYYLPLASGEAVVGLQADYGLSSLVGLIGGYLLQAAIVRSAILDLGGRGADLGGSLLLALRLLLPMIGLAIVSGFAILFGLVLLIVPGVILYVMWIAAVPVMVEERLGVFESLGRSAELTRGSRWKIFLLMLAYFILWGLIAAAFAILAPADAMVDPMTAGLVEAGTATVMGLLLAAMLASLYLEMRTVKEGASTDSLAAVFA